MRFPFMLLIFIQHVHEESNASKPCVCALILFLFSILIFIRFHSFPLNVVGCALSHHTYTKIKVRSISFHKIKTTMPRRVLNKCAYKLRIITMNRFIELRCLSLFPLFFSLALPFCVFHSMHRISYIFCVRCK